MARQHTALPNHSEFEREPASLGPLPLPQRQLHRNLNYILDGKRIVDGHATRGTLTQEERTLLDNSYNFSVARNRQVLLGIGPEGNPLDRINLTKKLKVRDATSRATAFGQAVWTTSERIRKEEEERIRQAKREYFMRSEFESMSMGRASETRNHDENLRYSSGSYMSSGPQERLFVANPNSRNTSTGGSLSDAQHSSKLYIPPDFQQTAFGTNSKSRNTSTEGIPPSTRMGSNLSLSRQSAMTRGSGSGYYPRSGSVNTASLEDDGTHFSMGSRASGSSEMYQLDPSTGYYSGEPDSSRYPAMYVSGQEYYRHQTQMAAPYYSPPPPPHASTSTDRQGMHQHGLEEPGPHHAQHHDAHKSRGHRSAHPEPKAQRR